MTNISINKIYSCILAVLSIWMLYLVLFDQNVNPSIDQSTTLLSAIVVGIISIFFWLRPESNEPMLLVLVYHLIAYYFLRVISLNYFEYTTALNRFGVPDPEQVFHGFTIVLYSIATILLGYKLAKINFQPVIQKPLPLASLNRLYIALIIFAVTIVYNFGPINSIFTSTHILLKLLSFFAHPAVIYIPLFLYFIATKFEQKTPFVIFIILLGVNMLNYSVAKGVRGEIVYLCEFIFYAFLVTNLISIKRKTLLSLLSVTPIFLLVLVNVYIGSSFQRGYIKDSENIFNAFANYYLNVTESNEYFYWIKHIAARVGSFDYSVELIINKHHYKDVFNPHYYKQSIVDNILTAGFDIYDAPRVGQSTVFHYTDLNDGIKSRQFISNQPFAHSDELTIIGELYALLGWGSLPVLLVVSFAISKVYYNINFVHPYYNYVTKVLLFLFLSKAFHSFGLDWLLLDIILYVAPCIFMSWIIYPPISIKRLLPQKG